MWPWLKPMSKKPPPLAQKSSAMGSLVAMNHLGQPVWTPRRYDALADEGYQRNVIVYRAVNLIARGAASVPWRLYHGQEELLHHPLLDVLHCPNPRQAGSSFVEQMLAYLLLSGNSYMEVSRDLDGKPAELYALRPDRVKVIPDRRGTVDSYEYTVNGQKRCLKGDCEQGYGDVLHLKLFHPLNDWYGLSPIEVAAGSIDQHNAVAGHNLALLQNGGRPSGALVVGQREPFYSLTDEQRDNIREDVTAMYTGHGNAGRVLVLEGDFQWKEMGLSPKDLDFIEGKNLSAREIAQAYGVPPMLVGVPGDATFANYKEARFHLWEDTILPLLDHFMDELNLWLAPQFQEELRLAYDIDRIPALIPRREEAWSKISNASFLTLNEKRRAMGYAPLKGGDRLETEKGHEQDAERELQL